MLFRLPPELLQYICFIFLDFRDVASVSMTCRTVYTRILDSEYTKRRHKAMVPLWIAFKMKMWDTVQFQLSKNLICTQDLWKFATGFPALNVEDNVENAKYLLRVRDSIVKRKKQWNPARTFLQLCNQFNKFTLLRTVMSTIDPQRAKTMMQEYGNFQNNSYFPDDLRELYFS